MDNKIKWLRISYWSAAIADFILSILVLIPSRMGVEQYVYPMGLMSAVAFSWGVLLVIADRRPVERRWSLIPTILVVALLGTVALLAGLSGVMPFIRMIPAIVASVAVLVILLWGYVRTRDLC